MQATLVATLTEAPTPELLARLSRESDWLEVRADLVGDLNPADLRRDYPGALLYTLRSRLEGGACEDASPERQRRLLQAVEGYDLLDLEVEHDLSPAVLSQVEPAKRIISWHGPASPTWRLRQRFERMAEHHARLFKLVPVVSNPSEAMAPLELLRSLRRSDLIAFAAGWSGTWTRPLAARFGAPVIYGSATERSGAPGQPSIAALRLDFGLPELGPVERLFGIVGDPVSHSLSPRIHNGAYHALEIPALYLPFEAVSFGDFWIDVVEQGGLGALGLPLQGLSVTSPFKDSALAVAGASSPLAQRLRAANTLVDRGGVWEAESTDPAGAVNAVREHGAAIRGTTAAVVGAGGAGRAAALGLLLDGARVTLVNRGRTTGGAAAQRLGVPFVALDEFSPRTFDLVVNATSLGHREDDELPFEPTAMAPGGVVLDMVYDRRPTRLVRQAAAAGLTVVDGREVLLQQAVRQFELMTGRALPVDRARQLLGIAPVGVG